MIEFTALALPILGWMLGSRTEESNNKKAKMKELEEDIKLFRKDKNSAWEEYHKVSTELYQVKKQLEELKEKQASLIAQNIILSQEVSKYQDKKDHSANMAFLEARVVQLEERCKLHKQDLATNNQAYGYLNQQWVELKKKYDLLVTEVKMYRGVVK